MGFLTAEVVGKFESEQDTSKLLYAPLEQSATFRKSRVYQIKYDGTEEEAQRQRVRREDVVFPSV